MVTFKITINIISFFLLLFFIYHIQGIGVIPHNTTLRVILWFWAIVCLVLYVTYSANLISFLSVYKPHTEVDSLEDLVSHKEYRIALVPGTASVELFRVGCASLVILYQIYSLTQNFFVHLSQQY